MRIKRMLLFIIIIAMLIPNGYVFAAPAPTISVKATDSAGVPISGALVPGDTIRVGVYMADFPGLSIAMPSIHFNPDVLEVFDPVTGLAYASGNYNYNDPLAKMFFTEGEAVNLDPNGWGGGITNTDSYPYLNNQTGLIRMLIESSGNRSLTGEQAVYFVDMRVKAAGDTELRLSTMQDGLVNINDPLSAFKKPESDWYETGAFPHYHDLSSKPVYAIYSGSNASIVTKSDSILVEPTSAAVLTEISVDTGDASGRCLVGDTFALRIYIKNIPEMYNLTIPFVYNTEIARLLDVERDDIPYEVMQPMPGEITNPFYEDIQKIVTVPSNMTLEQTSVHPLVDTTKGFVAVFILPATGNKLTLNGDKTLVATLYFKALKEGEFEYRFPTLYDEHGQATGETIHDPTAPIGVMVVGTRSDVGMIGAGPIFPNYAMAKLRIGKNDSKIPGEVIVYPLQPGPSPETADVLVADVVPGATVRLYYKDSFGNLIPIPDHTGNQAEAIANDQGYGVFVNIEIKDIIDYEIWATATEPNKDESEPIWGTPDLRDIIRVVYGFEYNEVIPVEIYTPEEGIPFYTTGTDNQEYVVANTAYYVVGYSFPFLLPPERNEILKTVSNWEASEYRVDSESLWETSDYKDNKPGIYKFITMPDPVELADRNLWMIDNLPSGYPPLNNFRSVSPPWQEVVVKSVTVDNGGGSNGGGGGGRLITTIPTPTEPVLPPAELEYAAHYRYLQGYPDGTIQPEGYITREETAAVFYRLLSTESRNNYRNTENNFPDVLEGMWSVTEISTLTKAKILKGDDMGNFRPRSSVTRAEFAAIATRFDNLPADANHGLTDIAGHWAEEAIAAAYQMGWVDGYEDGSFRPNDPITRAEAAKLINRVLKRRVDQHGLLDELVIDWPDLPVEHWAYYELMEATVSHESHHRYDNRIMEKWTGPADDINFDIE